MSGGRAGGAAGKSRGSRGVRILAVLVGFVLLAIGVTMRRVYGFGQAKQIREMEQRREALISEQLKLQDAIRVASDRAHLIDIAHSRLNMRLPAPNQVIFLPRRPLGAGRDSSRP